MSESIHGHDVMEMMVASEKTYSRETLELAINEKFGSEARFHVCSASDMTAKELIVCLKEKGKFVGPEDAFKTEASHICKH